jgi:phytoene dehydrogenase-like protein
MNDMQSNEQTWDVIVIGGGVAGLSAAAFAARQGKRTLLLEQSHALGGRARTKQQDGFHFNIGPHALYRGGRGIEILRELGVEIHGRVPSVSGAFAIKHGVKHTFPAGVVSLLTTSLFGLSSKIEAARLLGSIAKVDGNQIMGVSVREWVESSLSQRDVREMVFALFRVSTYANAPNEMSAGAAIEQLKLALAKSVLYLDGGWQTIVDGLAQAAARAGVEIETSAKAESVAFDARGFAQGAHLADGRFIAARNIIIASSPSEAVELVGRERSPELARRADEAIPVRAACLDVALNQLPKPKATFALGIDRPLYLSVHSATARLAPEGGALIQVAKYLAPDDRESNEKTERELEGLLDLMQPGWRGHLAHRRFLPDLVVMNAMPTAGGDGLRGRLGPQVDDADGLFVVGDWVGREGLLVDASLASAKQAADMIASASESALAAAS